MPTIIDYPTVLATAQSLGLRCVYPNSGAFAHARGADVRIVGWLGPDDPTIRADLPATFRRFPEPYATSLANRLVEVWRAHLGGPAWVMPKAHWSYELDHGNHVWLPDALTQIGIDPRSLQALTTGAAIEFVHTDQRLFGQFVAELLEKLVGSDFAVLFPQHAHLVTVHHHKQLWWQTADVAFASIL